MKLKTRNEKGPKFNPYQSFWEVARPCLSLSVSKQIADLSKQTADVHILITVLSVFVVVRRKQMYKFAMNKDLEENMQSMKALEAQNFIEETSESETDAEDEKDKKLTYKGSVAYDPQ